MSQHRLVLTIALLTAGMVHAQGARFGLQGTVSIPSADLKSITSSGGYGAALTMDIPLSGGHVLRPRFDYINYREKSQGDSFTSGEFSYSYTSKYSVNSAGLGIDYAYYTAGRPAGFYFLVGIQQSRYEIKDTYTEVISGQPTFTDEHRDKSKSKLGYAVGFGFDFNRHWGSELRLTNADLSDASEKSSFNAYNFGITYKF